MIIIKIYDIFNVKIIKHNIFKLYFHLPSNLVYMSSRKNMKFEGINVFCQYFLDYQNCPLKNYKNHIFCYYRRITLAYNLKFCTPSLKRLFKKTFCPFLTF